MIQIFLSLIIVFFLSFFLFLLRGNIIFALLAIAFSFLLLSFYIFFLLRREIKFEIPISKKIIIKNPTAISLEKKKKIDKISKPLIELISEIISKIKEKNPNITDDELSRRVLFEYEIEKKKYPELLQSQIKEFKIETQSKEKIKIKNLSIVTKEK